MKNLSLLFAVFSNVIFGLSFNINHLESLAQKFILNGREVKGYWVYAERRGERYHTVGAAGEGDFCVDDVARVVLLYCEAYELMGRDEYLKLAREASNFLIQMQAPDGQFYNFAYLDGTVNQHGPTSVKSSSWWALRAFWGLSKLARYFKEPEMLEAIRRAYHAIKRDPPKTADQLALFVLGLCEYDKISSVKDDIKRYTDELLPYLRKDFVGTFFSVYRDRFLWNGWGNHYAEALIEAFISTGKEEYLKVAKETLESQVPLLLGTGFVYSIGEHVRLFPELSYAVDCVVTPLVKLWNVTKDERYALLAALSASWLFGGNRLGVPMMGLNGEGYDGLEHSHVNRNAGAESTICALRTVLHTSLLPEEYRDLIERPRIVSRNGMIVLEAESGNPGISDVRIILGDFGGGAALSYQGRARLSWEKPELSGKYKIFVSGNFLETTVTLSSKSGERISKDVRGEGIFKIGELSLDGILRVSLSGKGTLDQLILVPEKYGVSFLKGDDVKTVFFDLMDDSLKFHDGQLFVSKETEKKEMLFQVSIERISKFVVLDLSSVFNNDGFGTPESPGNFDNPSGVVGAYLPAREVREGLVEVEGIPFLLKTEGLDNMRCLGQRIVLPEKLEVRGLHLLAASNHGDYELSVTFEGSTVSVLVTDWCVPPKTLTFDFRYTADGRKQNMKCGLNLISVRVERSIQEIVFSEVPNVHVFAVTLELVGEGE